MSLCLFWSKKEESHQDAKTKAQITSGRWLVYVSLLNSWYIHNPQFPFSIKEGGGEGGKKKEEEGIIVIIII